MLDHLNTLIEKDGHPGMSQRQIEAILVNCYELSPYDRENVIRALSKKCKATVTSLRKLYKVIEAREKANDDTYLHSTVTPTQ